VNVGSDATINTGSTFTRAGSFIDPGADTWTASVDYGDGTGSHALTLESKTLSLSNSFVNPGVYTVTVKVNDGTGDSFGTFKVTVTESTNSAPVLGDIQVPVDPVKVNTPVTVSASLTDSDSQDTFTTKLMWDDGKSDLANLLAGTRAFTNSHTYAEPGVYLINLTITDNRGLSDYKEAKSYIVVYDPNGGFVTGGGWIISPAGAFIKDPAMTGKATFGFVSKYVKGKTLPTGDTEFQFQTAKLNFKSTSYDWLVVAGAKAQYKGTGTVNGTGNYGFMLSAIDGDVNKIKGPDKFRIKIWDKANADVVVYDNLIGAPDDADPITVIGGGSIVVHK
jgi:PKD repeat protein